MSAFTLKKFAKVAVQKANSVIIHNKTSPVATWAEKPLRTEESFTPKAT